MSTPRIDARDGISQAISQAGAVLSSGDLDVSRVRLGVALRLLNAAGWDVFDVSQVVPDYRTGNARVDFTLMASPPGTSRSPAIPQVLIEVKSQDENLESSRAQRRIIAHCAREGAPLAALTNGRRWLLLFQSSESSSGDHLFCDVDLVEDPDAAADSFSRYLSRDRVASGQAARSAERTLRDRNRDEVSRQAILDGWRRVVAGLDEGLLELVATAAEQRTGLRPETGLVRRVLFEQRAALLTSGEERGAPVRTGVGLRRRPASFTFMSETRAVSSWPGLLVKVCSLMHDRHREEFDQILEIRGRTLSYFSKSEESVHIPKQIGDSGIYASCRGGADLLEKRAKEVVELFGHPADSLAIELG